MGAPLSQAQVRRGPKSDGVGLGLSTGGRGDGENGGKYEALVRVRVAVSEALSEGETTNEADVAKKGARAGIAPEKIRRGRRTGNKSRRETAAKG
jgi:hypothetical protein